MLSGEKILITGAAGIIGLPLAEWLARDNEVWGLARFSGATALAEVESAGVIPYRSDLEKADFSELPDDFTYVIHLATLSSGADYDRAIAVNAEGTGLLLHHCRRAKAALVMSTHSVYKPHEDPRHAYIERDPLGDANPSISPTYSVSKIAQEAVARYCARAFDLPVVVARMNVSFGPRGGLPVAHLDAVASGKPVTTKWDPCLYSPIYVDDINEQAAAILQRGERARGHRQLGGGRPRECPGLGGVHGRVDRAPSRGGRAGGARYPARPGRGRLEETSDHRALPGRLARRTSAHLPGPLWRRANGPSRNACVVGVRAGRQGSGLPRGRLLWSNSGPALDATGERHRGYGCFQSTD